MKIIGDNLDIVAEKPESMGQNLNRWTIQISSTVWSKNIRYFDG